MGLVAMVASGGCIGAWVWRGVLAGIAGIESVGWKR